MLGLTVSYRSTAVAARRTLQRVALSLIKQIAWIGIAMGSLGIRGRRNTMHAIVTARSLGSHIAVA